MHGTTARTPYGPSYASWAGGFGKRKRTSVARALACVASPSGCRFRALGCRKSRKDRR